MGVYRVDFQSEYLNNTRSAKCGSGIFLSRFLRKRTKKPLTKGARGSKLSRYPLVAGFMGLTFSSLLYHRLLQEPDRRKHLLLPSGTLPDG